MSSLIPCKNAFLTIWGRTENFEGIAVSRWGGYDTAMPVIIINVREYGDACHCRTLFANE